jgi:hypothetical protein
MTTSTTATATTPVIKIEKGIPLPKYTKLPAQAKDSLSEDLQKMKPLESRMIDIDYDKKKLNAVRTRIHHIVKKYNLKDRVYTVNVDPVTQKKLRVWRVS